MSYATVIETVLGVACPDCGATTAVLTDSQPTSEPGERTESFRCPDGHEWVETVVDPVCGQGTNAGTCGLLSGHDEPCRAGAL